MPNAFWRWLADRLYPFLSDRWHAEERERRRKVRTFISLVKLREDKKP
jgi:hypothetical protein